MYKRAVSYMPFSEGPRNCVGQSLSKMEVLVVLAKLLAAFR
jgi:cytochrome P450